MKSDNPPQVGTCQRHDGGDKPHAKAIGCIDWTPDTPQPTPAEPRKGWCWTRASNHRGMHFKDASCNDWHDGEPNGEKAEPRIETVPGEREAQAEAVNKIWNQFRSGDGEEDCELYRALEKAYGAGRARAGAHPEPEERAARKLERIIRETGEETLGSAICKIREWRARVGVDNAEGRDFTGYYCSTCGSSQQPCEHFPSPPSSPGAAQRSHKDLAIEHGEYLAKSAEFLLNSINEENRLQVEADPDRDEELIDYARETRNDAWKGLNSAIYEFRKRANRCSPGAPQEAVTHKRTRGSCDRSSQKSVAR